MKQTFKILLLLTSLFILVYSCKKESNNSSNNPPPSVSGTGTVTTTIAGRATDESNNAVANATVVINGQTTATDGYGIFLFKNINVSSRCIATITRTGYFNCTHAFMANANTVNYIKVVLVSNSQTQALSATTGGTVSLLDYSSVWFPANSFVTASTGSAYTGTVYVAVKHLSPDSANFGFMIPGGDLLGKDSTGHDVALYTYGMMGVEIKGSGGEQLQLATSTTASLRMTIAYSQSGTAPSSIPLWYFDEATSLWKEEGSATRSGNTYVGTVSHFSWWNCDVGNNRGIILGKVLDCNGVPMPNVVVTVNGYFTLVTNQGGIYSNWVPAGRPLTVQVFASNNSIALNSQLENVPALSINQNYTLPDLIVPCPARISGTLKTCSGSFTAGMVYESWTVGNYFQYSYDGNFNMPCPTSTQINISAYSDYSFSGQYSSSILGSTINIGNIFLCSQNFNSPNDFTVNGGPFSNQHFLIDTTATWADTTSRPGAFLIHIQGTAPTGNIISNYELRLSSDTVGEYAWNTQDSVNLFFYSSAIGDYYEVTTEAASSGVTTLGHSGAVGDRVVGQFSGNATGYFYSNANPVTVSGNFKVRRR